MHHVTFSIYTRIYMCRFVLGRRLRSHCHLLPPRYTVLQPRSHHRSGAWRSWLHPAWRPMARPPSLLHCWKPLALEDCAACATCGLEGCVARSRVSSELVLGCTKGSLTKEDGIYLICCYAMLCSAMLCYAMLCFVVKGGSC